ncbi:MAG: hotdog fold thioesterase [Anaerolineae bacterium]
MTERTRTVMWEDPMIGAQASTTMSGLEYLRAIQEGKLPAAPIAALLGMDIAEVEEGCVVFSAIPGEYLYNPIGTVHGGFVATICDSVMGCAVHSTLPAGTGYTTLEIKINYLRAITIQTGRVYCEGKVIHAGRRVAVAESRVTDANGKLYGYGSTTCAILTP